MTFAREKPAASAAPSGSAPPGREAADPADLFARVRAACRRTLFFAGFFSLFINVLQLTVSLFMMQVFDRVLPSGNVNTLLLLVVIALAALLAMSLLDVARARIMTRVGVWFERRLSLPTLERVIEASLSGSSQAVQALQDLGTVRAFFSSPAMNALFDTPWMPVYLLAIAMLHPLLGGVAVIGAVLLFILALLNEFATRRALNAAGQLSRKAAAMAGAAARNAEAVDAMGMTPGLLRRWFRESDAALSLQTKAADNGALLTAASKFARLVLQLAVLGLGALLVLQEQMTAGAMIGASIIMSRALAPVEQAMGAWRQFVGMRAAWQRLEKLFAAPFSRGHGMKLPDPKGYLAVERASLMLPGVPRPILKGVSFDAAPGEAVAVIGPSAAGKSTLARLLVGTRKPTGGAVRLDGADVYEWNRTDFGRHVGYLPQDVELFEGTVQENIARLGEADPADIVDAARMAGIHDMILHLPQGYDTPIGEGGALLSGGQRQRIALARALYRRPRLLVLDEPNASLDAEGEEALTAAIRAMKEDGACVVVISHRPNILKVADKLVVLVGGAVELFGPTAEVIAELNRRSARRLEGTRQPGGDEGQVEKLQERKAG